MNHPSFPYILRKVLQRYHPHNVDRREKRKNERISKLRITVQQKDVEIKKL